MKKTVLLLSLVMLVPLVGCTSKAMRYSTEEIQDLPPSIQEHIKKSEIAVGMTMLQVRYAWGSPDMIIVLPPDEDGKERVEWTYKNLYVFKTRLIFTGNRLTEIVSTDPGAGLAK